MKLIIRKYETFTTLKYKEIILQFGLFEVSTSEQHL